ncbi:MAG: hypothetical protein R8G34_11695 [Paracoccaceae bacterium]|nr:hypothetical protein [Paracoccaceae bacterium]
MKKQFIVFWLLACVVSNFALADPISVRSGDHTGFTRLVMRLPSEVQWEVSGQPGSQVISFLGHEDGFDISRVFNLIPRDYLKEIKTYPSRLELELSCDCDTKFFVEKGSFLVIDILDGPPLSKNALTTQGSYKSLKAQSNFAFGELLWPSATSDDDQFLLTQEQQSPESESGSAPVSSLSSQEIGTVETTRQELLRSVVDATSRGLVEPSVPSLDAAVKQEMPEPGIVIFDSSDQMVSPTFNEIVNLRITNSRDVPRRVDTVDLTTSGVVCADPISVNVPNWGDETKFHSQISLLRQSLFSELGRLDEKVAIDLARAYIFFGFGVEAKQTLRLSDKLVLENPELMDLADIVDIGFVRNPRIVHHFADCASDLALWGILAARTFSKDQVADDRAALRALVKLPPQLRDYLAPILSKRLAEIGKTEAASVALRRVNLDANQSAPSTELASAYIQQNSSNNASAARILSNVSNANSIDSPEALLLYVENRLADLTPIDPDTSLLIEAYAFELQDSRIAPELSRAHAIASALSGQFKKAFDVIEKDQFYQNAESLDDLRSSVFSVLAKNASDVEFLDIAFGYFPENSRSIRPLSALAIAKRMNSLGFASAAADILADIDNTERNLQAILLEAEVLLALDKPTEALEILQSTLGQEADLIRAQALFRIGENARAIQLFQAANMSETAKRAAWLSDDWVELVSQQSNTFEDIRELANGSVDPVIIEDGMISATQNALDESASARTIVADLLRDLVVTSQ